MRKRWLTLLSVAMIAMVMLAACGNGDDDDDDDAADDAASDFNGMPVAMLDEMAFEPETLTVSAGEDVEIALTNEGAITHNFSIEGADVSVDLDGGDMETVTFTAPEEPGEYKIFCDEPGHEGAGMIGTLVVE